MLVKRPINIFFLISSSCSSTSTSDQMYIFSLNLQFLLHFLIQFVNCYQLKILIEYKYPFWQTVLMAKTPILIFCRIKPNILSENSTEIQVGLSISQVSQDLINCFIYLQLVDGCLDFWAKCNHLLLKVLIGYCSVSRTHLKRT